jgi:peptidoglycan/xylan/chitin deacetylase (PgdA/CDA1 family)
MIPKILKWGALATILGASLSGTPTLRRATDSHEQSQVNVPLLAELERGPRHLRQVALTFDAGGEADGLTALLQRLEQEKVTATFFLTGQWTCTNLHLATLISDHGHVIGNHTWAHKDLTTLEDWEVRQELLRTDDRFVGWFGPDYLPLFRAPYGETNPQVLSVAQDLGFHTIRWSIDTLDAMEPRKTSSFIEKRVLDRSDDDLKGAIVLMHVGYLETIDALPRVIHELRERGFEFVTINDWIPGLHRTDARPGSTLPSQNVPAAKPPAPQAPPATDLETK